MSTKKELAKMIEDKKGYVGMYDASIPTETAKLKALQEMKDAGADVSTELARVSGMLEYDKERREIHRTALASLEAAWVKLGF